MGQTSHRHSAGQPLTLLSVLMEPLRGTSMKTVVLTHAWAPHSSVGHALWDGGGTKVFLKLPRLPTPWQGGEALDSGYWAGRLRAGEQRGKPEHSGLPLGEGHQLSPRTPPEAPFPRTLACRCEGKRRRSKSKKGNHRVSSAAASGVTHGCARCAFPGCHQVGPPPSVSHPRPLRARPRPFIPALRDRTR